MYDKKTNAGFWGRACARLCIKNRELKAENVKLLNVCKAIKIRIAFIDHPNEPKDWAKEITLVETVTALKGKQ